MIDTAGTLTNGASALIELGAKEVYACCTHAVLSGEAIERIQNSPIKKVLTLDTIAIPKEKMIDKIRIESVAPIFAQAINRIFTNKPISAIFPSN